MKIIKDNYTKTYRCTCPKCTSIFEFNQGEIIREGFTLKIYCPLCRLEIQLATNKNEELRNVVEVKRKTTSKESTSK